MGRLPTIWPWPIWCNTSTPTPEPAPTPAPGPQQQPTTTESTEPVTQPGVEPEAPVPVSLPDSEPSGIETEAEKVDLPKDDKEPVSTSKRPGMTPEQQAKTRPNNKKEFDEDF